MVVESKHLWSYFFPRVCQISLYKLMIIFPWSNFFIYLSWRASKDTGALDFILLGNPLLLQIKQAYHSLFNITVDSHKLDAQKLYSGQSRKHVFGQITFWLSSNLTLEWHVVGANNLQNIASCTTKIFWEGHCFYLDIHHWYVCLSGFVCYVSVLRASRELQWDRNWRKF